MKCRLCRPDLAIAVGLGVLYVVAVMSTTDMGFTRDEVFYFRYSKTYLDWFVELNRAGASEERRELLSRKSVKQTWRKNFEHPPMMKVLFGLSWKFLGVKRRPVTISGDGRVLVEKLGLSHGFEPGDSVLLLRPSAVGEDPASSDRIVATVTMTERAGRRGTGEVSGDFADVESLKELCDGARHRSSQPPQTGCEVSSNDFLQVFGESDAFRFPGAVMGGLLIALLFLFAVPLAGRATALLAVLLLATIPRVFFHAHLTCFDVPITAINFLVIFSFWRSLNSTRWAVATGVFWGVALLTKNNSFFVPVCLGLWFLVASIPAIRRKQANLVLPRFPLAFVLMPLIGLPMLFMFWPWLWYDSMSAFGKYLGFHLHHEHYFQYYFGRAYQSPPFPVDFPFVMTLITVPVLTLVAFFIGFGAMFMEPLVRWLRARARPGKQWLSGTFILTNLAFPTVLIALPSTPIFGGVKHWFLSMPYLCLIAGFGLVQVMRLAWAGLCRLGVPDKRLVQGVLAVLFTGLLLGPGARDTLRYVNNGTAYYNELIGGVRGAADRQMQRQFWSYANRGALAWVNENARYGAVVDFQDALPGACDMYRLEGWLRHDLRCTVRSASPDVLLFDVEERFSEEEQRYWKKLRTAGPVHEVTVDGVPVLRVYQKE